MKEGNHCGLFFSYLLIFVRGWGALVNGFRLFICGGMIRVNTETYSHLPSSHKRTGSHTESYSYEYSYTFPWWRIRYSVISSRGYTPPALLASLKYAHPPCVLSLLALLMLTYFFTYSSVGHKRVILSHGARRQFLYWYSNTAVIYMLLNHGNS